MFRIFAPHAVDFYKTSHPFQFPEGLEGLYGNFTPRGDKYANVLSDFDHKVLWVGFQAVIQYLLIDNWNDTFFSQPKDEVVARYKRRMDRAIGLNKVPTSRLAALHDLGYLPIKVKSIPEGCRVDVRVACYTCESTHPDHAWVEQYLETQMSAETWKASVTTATTAFEYRRLFEKYAIKTGSPLDFVLFQGHDFSMRGMSGLADATTSGAAHLMVFRGTDTVTSIDFLEDFYPDPVDPFIAGSVPATEHAVSSSNIIGIAESLRTTRKWNGWDVVDDLLPRDVPWLISGPMPVMIMAEVAFLKHMLVDLYPSGIFSYVADTYDFWTVITKIAAHLKTDIMARDGKCVFRPDSGDPVDIVVGDSKAETWTPQFKGAVECLWDTFGGAINEQGYKVLDGHVGLIYGDSISLDRAERILEGLEAKGFASCNVVFGIGSFTYQYVTRDTYGTAIKATHAVINGKAHELFKDPKTDSGVKKSAKGYICVKLEDGKYVQYDCQTKEQSDGGELVTVFEDSKMVKMWTLSEVRDRIDSALAGLR